MTERIRDAFGSVDGHTFAMESAAIVAGYVLVRPATSPPDMDSVPAAILTISDCIMDDLPRPEYWDWFQNVDDAMRASEATGNSHVVEVVFETGDAAAFIEEIDGVGQPFFELLRRAETPTGTRLGYELVGAEDTLDFHSWHCHGYADDLRLETGITVNEYGLLRSYADAAKALAWMLALPAAEAPKPVPWAVVALHAKP